MARSGMVWMNFKKILYYWEKVKFSKWQFKFLFAFILLMISGWPIYTFITLGLLLNLFLFQYLKITGFLFAFYFSLRYFLPVHVYPQLDQIDEPHYEDSIFPSSPYELTKEHLYSWEHEGFVVLRDVFSPQVIKNAHIILRPIVDDCEEDDCSEWGNWYYVPFMRKLAVAGSPIAEGFLNTTDVRLMTDRYKRDKPHAKRFGMWHRDRTFDVTQWQNDSVAIFCPTMNIEHENFIFYDRKFRPRQCTKTKKDETWQQCRDSMTSAGTKLDLKAGDCVAYHKQQILATYSIDDTNMYLEAFTLYYSPTDTHYKGTHYRPIYDHHHKHLWCDHDIPWRGKLEHDCFPLTHSEESLNESLKKVRLHFPIYSFRISRLIWYFNHTHSYEFEFEFCFYAAIIGVIIFLSYVQLEQAFVIDYILLAKKKA